MGFLVDNNPAAYINIGSIAIVYYSKHCSGLPSDTTIPPYYVSTYALSASSGALTETLKSTCLAYYVVASPSDPTNKTVLDTLTMQFAQDYLAWKKVTYDFTFAGVCALAPCALNDVIEIDYLSERDLCKTRVYSYPLNWTVNNLAHYDYADDCVNSVDTGLLNWDAQFYRAVYGPPAQCVDGSLQLTRWGISFTDGRLNKKYLSTDTIS